MKMSMNGFRRNLHGDVHRLKQMVAEVVKEDGYFDKEALVEAMNAVICQSNVLNCVYVENDPDFTDMGDLELEHLGMPEE